MRNILPLNNVRDSLFGLESAAAGAGCAMACRFASSAEFEASVIKARIEAGGYGCKHRWRGLFATAAAGALLAALFYAA
jgi:hypothetical protein